MRCYGNRMRAGRSLYNGHVGQRAVSDVPGDLVARLRRDEEGSDRDKDLVECSAVWLDVGVEADRDLVEPRVADGDVSRGGTMRRQGRTSRERRGPAHVTIAPIKPVRTSTYHAEQTG